MILSLQPQKWAGQLCPVQKQTYFFGVFNTWSKLKWEENLQVKWLHVEMEVNIYVKRVMKREAFYLQTFQWMTPRWFLQSAMLFMKVTTILTHSKVSMGPGKPHPVDRIWNTIYKGFILTPRQTSSFIFSTPMSREWPSDQGIKMKPRNDGYTECTLAPKGVRSLQRHNHATMPLEDKVQNELKACVRRISVSLRAPLLIL